MHRGVAEAIPDAISGPDRKNMSTQTETSQSGVLDILKLAIAAGVLVGGLYGYYFYENDVALPLRVLMVLAGAGAGIAIAMTSMQGQRLAGRLTGLEGIRGILSGLTVVHRSRLFELRTQGEDIPRGAHRAHGIAGEVRRDSRPDRGSGRDEGRAEAPQ
jgi:hypothetical protein